MRRLYLLAFVSILTLTINAIPARRGTWKTLTLTDGSTVRAELRGDEFAKFYRSETGECYIATDEGMYQKVEMDVATSKGAARRAKTKARMQRKTATRVAGADYSFTGEKKGLIILVQFSDTKFQTGHNQNFYKRVANEQGFTTSDGFNGSVADYFRDQSLGKFNLTFDVAGPVTMPKKASYYGANDSEGADKYVGELVAYACQQVDDEIDFSTYDWDNDGVAEEVFILYAGSGEHSDGGANTIWPHMYYLSYSDYRKSLTLDNTVIDCYACSSELSYRTYVDGIGTFCHEFSHCMGFPDMYDTGSGGCFGMSQWSLMDYGSYNDNGFTPSGYTAYERWVCGWITPVELTKATQVSALKTVQEGGNAYIVYNSGNKDEVIIMENRQQTGWDAAQYGSGLMIYHIDYDEYVWYMNTVNNSSDRQRITIFPADGTLKDTALSLAGDPWPYGSNDEFGYVNSSKPQWYSADEMGSYDISFAITDITDNNDGTVDFTFGLEEEQPALEEFYESFDKNNGKGGNDGSNKRFTSAHIVTDLDGWSSYKSFNAYKCIRIGSTTYQGWVLSPHVSVSQGSTFSCLGMMYNDKETIMTVSFISSTTQKEDTLAQVVLNDDGWANGSVEWTKCEIPITFNDTGRFKITTTERQYLDEVILKKPSSTAIKAIRRESTTPSDNRIYSIDGRYLGTDINSLGRGLYIINGRKIVK